MAHKFPIVVFGKRWWQEDETPQTKKIVRDAKIANHKLKRKISK